MASEVSICNEALRELKERRIDALNDGSKNGNLCGELYAETRQQLLSMHAWNFATKLQKLAQSATAPAFGYAHQYALPADYVRAVDLHDNAAGMGSFTDYRIRNGFVQADAGDLYLSYVADETDPNKMSPLFRRALALLLAGKLAKAVANSDTTAQRIRMEFDDTLPQAMSVDAIEDGPERQPESAWIAARY